MLACARAAQHGRPSGVRICAATPTAAFSRHRGRCQMAAPQDDVQPARDGQGPRQGLGQAPAQGPGVAGRSEHGTVPRGQDRAKQRRGLDGPSAPEVTVDSHGGFGRVNSGHCRRMPVAAPSRSLQVVLPPIRFRSAHIEVSSYTEVLALTSKIRHQSECTGSQPPRLALRSDNTCRCKYAGTVMFIRRVACRPLVRCCPDGRTCPRYREGRDTPRGDVCSS